MNSQTDILSRRALLASAGALALAGSLCSVSDVAAARQTPAMSRGSESRPEDLWSSQAWQEAEPVYKAILNHPYLKSLADGSLPKEKFIYYTEQNAVYLAEYARTLSAIASRLPTITHRRTLTEYATTTIASESWTYDSYRKLTGRELVMPRPAPSCLAYTSFEAQQAARAPVEVAMATILPCFWVYWGVGRHLVENQTKRPGNPYQDWINAYNDETFGQSVQTAINICDELAEATTPAVRKDMTLSFVQAVRYEWMFWEASWTMQRWPV